MIFKPSCYLALGREEFVAKVGAGNPEKPVEMEAILRFDEGRAR